LILEKLFAAENARGFNENHTPQPLDHAHQKNRPNLQNQPKEGIMTIRQKFWGHAIALGRKLTFDIFVNIICW
jgi:hypothetical protein